MMRSRLPVLALLAVLATGPALAEGAAYLRPSDLDVADALGPPPAEGSAEAARDLEAVLALQAQRTPAAVERAQADRKESVFRFRDVLGERFRKKRLPVTEALFEQLTVDVETLLGDVKQRWPRQRPFQVDGRVSLCVKRPKSGSYPSSHAAAGRLYALVLAEMVPERRDELMRRGDLYGDARSLCGAHFPTDVAAGRRAADAMHARLMAKPAFRADLASARAELRAALRL